LFIISTITTYAAAGCKSATGGQRLVRQVYGFTDEERNKELYLVLKKKTPRSSWKKQLRRLFHQYDTNSVEGFNLQRNSSNRTYCQTIETRHGQCAAGLQSVGYQQFWASFAPFIYGGRRHYQPLFDRKTPTKLWRQQHRKKEHVR
jgi:hypothetical protein